MREINEEEQMVFAASRLTIMKRDWLIECVGILFC
jgi:hypothetical protein